MLVNETEKEVALLLAALKLIKGMVNHSMLSLSGDNTELCVRPMTMETAELFNILLVDFISPLGTPYARDLTMLSGLSEICKAPHFNVDNSLRPLSAAVEELTVWFDYEATFDEIWLPSIDRELSLVMARKEFIYNCGNIAKHNTFRLTVVAKKLLAILQRSDPSTTLKDAYLAIEDFYRWFHEDIFLYHLSKLSQMLNNIAWGIQDYLMPAYARSYTIDEEASATMHAGMYLFDYPADITSELGRVYYWDLMNEIRAKPYIARFGVSKYLCDRY